MGGSANFTKCALRYLGSPELIARYNYSGPVRLIPANPRTQITYKGCEALCGTGSDWYEWSISASFITTWLLPILGTLLQAPFESNAFWRTLKAVCRWTGSPMSSLSYILWNIEVSGKCALFVDMATAFEERSSDEDSEFASMRDSFYLLMNINEYEMKPLISLTKEAEGLLRLMLFSKDLKLVGHRKTLHQMRKKLASELRSNRRRGVVPVFVSTLWFIFSLGISVQSAFGYLGDNAQAHDLAIGLFMGWFPVLVLCSIVDRNPVASDDIRRKLNKLVNLVCDSIEDEQNRTEYIHSFSDLPQSQHMAFWVNQIAARAPIIRGEYFTSFAGQGRVRFHYGAAHAILIDIEKAYIADHGRGWLKDEREARASLVLGQVERTFVWFDGRQLWQISAAFALVAGTTTGAFILSYFTPTVGLSCRSGGYLIFAVVAFSLLVSEFATWVFTSPVRNEKQRARMSSHLEPFISHATTGTERSKAPSPFMRLFHHAKGGLTRAMQPLHRHLPGHIQRRLENQSHDLHQLTVRQWTEFLFFQPTEAFNTVWLIYLFIAQTSGAFNNCACQTSIWGGSSKGGYLDFTQWEYSNAPDIQLYWITGTIVSCVFLGLGIIYVVLEWCLQAHLSTENYSDAMRGLQMARMFRSCTYWVRYPATILVMVLNRLANLLRMRNTSERKDLVWRKNSTVKPRVGALMVRLASEMHTMPFKEVEATVTAESHDVERGQPAVAATRDSS